MIDQLIQTLHTNGGKHGIQITLSWSDVTVRKRLRIKGVELVHKYANLTFPQEFRTTKQSEINFFLNFIAPLKQTHHI
jgi:hypothetical protein